MLRNLSIGWKIGGGFGIVLLLLAGMAAWSLLGIGRIVYDAEEVITGNAIEGELAAREVDHLRWVGKVGALINDDEVRTLDVQTDPHKCALGTWYYGEGRAEVEEHFPDLRGVFVRLEKPHAQLHATAEAIGENYRYVDPALGAFLREAKVKHLLWAHKVKDVFFDPSVTELDVHTDPETCFLGTWLYSDAVARERREDPGFAALWDAVEADHTQLHHAAIDVQADLAAGDRGAARRVVLETVVPAGERTLAGIDALIAHGEKDMAGVREATRIFNEETGAALAEVTGLLDEARDRLASQVMTDAEMLADAHDTRVGVSVLAALALVLGTLLAVVLTLTVVRALRGIMGNLGLGAAQVASASAQVAQASTELAEGASTQAANLEETSATLEELSSMTRRNTENATEANALAGQLRGVASGGQEAMGRMTGAISKIKDSADQTANIVKTIDEIAFQTNLLALNAAVEAARAGDAGKGFAVVAEEVRTLAQRSAEAARNTTSLIAQSQQDAQGGVEVTREVDTILGEIVTGVARVSELVESVSAASAEQAEGVGSINDAVGRMDEVTQGNAAGAEETASAGEELSAQAEELNRMVQDLQRIVDGGRHAPAKASPPPPAPPRRPAPPREDPPRDDRSDPQDESDIPLEEVELAGF